MNKSMKRLKFRVLLNHIVFDITILTGLNLFVACQFKEKSPDPENFEFLEADINQIQQGYRDGSLTVKELVQAYLDRIEEIEEW